MTLSLKFNCDVPLTIVILSTVGCTSPLLDGIQPHLGLPTHPLPLHAFTPSPTPGSSSSSTKPHLLRYVNKEIIKDVDLPGLSVEDIEAVLSENEDWSGEQMDQFLRSAIDLSDIESKVLSGGYESDSGYSTYDVSPITSTAPTQLTFATSSQLAGLQAHGHHVDQSLFTCNLSPTATMFPGGLGHPQPLLHDTIHSPCSSDVGFFSPHSGFSSHATTPSHQDALSFFPAHGGPCPMFTSYSQPQDFNTLNLSTCFPDAGIPNPDTTIPTFSSQIPDILLPDASFAPPSHPPMSLPDPIATIATTSTRGAGMAKFPKSEQPIHSACKVQPPPPPQVTKTVAVESSDPNQNSESAGEVKIESHPNSCVFAAPTLPEVAGSESAGLKEEGAEQETQTVGKQVTAKSLPATSNSSQELLNKLLGQNGSVPPTILSITAINNNGTKTKLDLSQLQAIVGQPNNSEKGTTRIITKLATSQHSGSASDGETASSCSQASSSKSKCGSSGPKSVPMKASQRKKGQWPRSMNKANLMAFREHILNKLKKGQESSACSTGDGCQRENTTAPANSAELMKCETPSPSSGSDEVKVTYERNHSAESRCHSEPAEMFSVPTLCPSSSSSPLQSSHSESYLNDTAASTQHGFGSSDADTKLADFFPQNCNDVFNLFQFNPDALLSTAIDDQMLDSIDFVFSDDDTCKVDNEIAQLLDSEMPGATSETPMELGIQYDVMRDHSPITTSQCHASPLVSPNSQPSSSEKSTTPSCGYSSVIPTDSSTTYHSERALVTGHVTSGSMETIQMGMFNFPNMMVSSNEVGEALIGSDVKLHIQQNLLQAHHDPLLTGTSTLLQACGPEAFEF